MVKIEIQIEEKVSFQQSPIPNLKKHIAHVVQNQTKSLRKKQKLPRKIEIQ